jgi:hypothetical protein
MEQFLPDEVFDKQEHDNLLADVCILRTVIYMIDKGYANPNFDLRPEPFIRDVKKSISHFN